MCVIEPVTKRNIRALYVLYMLFLAVSYSGPQVKPVAPQVPSPVVIGEAVGGSTEA